MQANSSKAGADGDGLAPLVLTLRMDDASAARFTAMRRQHFPADRNWLDAHVTLFHALPGEALDTVLADVREVARRTSSFPLAIDRVLLLGAGVAYALRSVPAVALRSALALRWEPLLTRQDRAWRGPLHVTVQNKVDPTTARALHEHLAESFVPGVIRATGIDVWRYEGGPWRHVATARFA